MKALLAGLVLFTVPANELAAQVADREPLPIIDVHVHAMAANAFGKPPLPVCAPYVAFSPRDPKDRYDMADIGTCPSPLQSVMTSDAQMTQTLAIMRRFNVVGVVGGPMALVRRWKAAAPDRVIPAVGAVQRDSIRRWSRDGSARVMAELAFQYGGIAPGDSLPESCFALAEQLDMPVGLHVGPGPPGTAYMDTPKYRMSLSNPLLLEEVLLRHPRLRLYVMHAGWPMGDQMIALLYAHPQVYVDVGVIDWAIPRKEFYAYLQRLTDAGFGKRIMFGSDQMVWPEAMQRAIETIQEAPFLDESQKRDIFYNNAARFLRLTGQGQH